MAKNKLGDLDDHLFAALERLADEELTPDQIDAEVRRATAVVEIGDTIVRNAAVKITAAKLFAEHGSQVTPYLPAIGRSQE